MTLEDQLEKLAKLNLRLGSGITVEDLLFSWSRESYDATPFDLILFAFGSEVEREPYGRHISSDVWNFDLECIGSTGDYTKIVRRLCQLSGRVEHLENISDFVDLEAGEAWLKYRVNGVERYWPIEVDNDWADILAIKYVMEDIQREDCRFYFKDNGQAMILFYLDSFRAASMNRITGGARKPVLTD